MRAGSRPHVVAAVFLALLAVQILPAEASRRTLPGTVEELLALDARPFAIAHRGFGDNLGGDPTRPIENTVQAVRDGFQAGASVVEVDVQLTRDGKVVVFHDDFLLPDLTCLNTLTLAQLRARVPWVPTLQDILAVAQQFNQASGPLKGIVIVELKAAAPLCDPHDIHEHAIVAAVTAVVRRTHMTHQVMLTSFSPALLSIAQRQAPDITRILSLSGLQFLPASAVQDALDMDVTLIDKKLGLGLQWAEVGSLFRLPGYRSLDEVFSTVHATGARIVELELFLLQIVLPVVLQVDPQDFVDALHASGLKALGFTASTASDWDFLASLRLDGIYANDVPFGVAHEAPIP
jgi:glycerophosphoryl diester phosphodiesterase